MGLGLLPPMQPLCHKHVYIHCLTGCRALGCTLYGHNHFVAFAAPACVVCPVDHLHPATLQQVGGFHQKKVGFSLHFRPLDGMYITHNIIIGRLPPTYTDETESAILARLTGPRGAVKPSDDMRLDPPLTGIRTAEQLPQVRGLAWCAFAGGSPVLCVPVARQSDALHDACDPNDRLMNFCRIKHQGWGPSSGGCTLLRWTVVCMVHLHAVNVSMHLLTRAHTSHPLPPSLTMTNISSGGCSFVHWAVV